MAKFRFHVVLVSSVRGVRKLLKYGGWEEVEE